MVAVYLDDELDANSCNGFEQHVALCPSCAAELLEQRRLLGVLDAALSREFDQVRLPKNFAQTLAARAESDMSGVRSRGENGRALCLCAVLAATILAALGTAAAAAAFAPIATVARAATGIVGILGHTLSDVGASVAVVLRIIGGHYFSEPTPLVILTWTSVAAAVVLLRQLVSRYHNQSAH